MGTWFHAVATATALPPASARECEEAEPTVTTPVHPAAPVAHTSRETLRVGRASRFGLLAQTWGLGLAAVALTVGFLLAVSDLVSRLG